MDAGAVGGRVRIADCLQNIAAVNAAVVLALHHDSPVLHLSAGAAVALCDRLTAFSSL